MKATLDLKNQMLIIWRDSVAAGDDIDAPHEFKLPVQNHESLREVIDRIVAARYLASIAGGKATWIVEAGSRPLAVVVQQWSQARYLVEAGQSFSAFVSDAGKCHFYFKYWGQADPDQVYECLREDKPLPHRYTHPSFIPSQ